LAQDRINPSKKGKVIHRQGNMFESGRLLSDRLLNIRPGHQDLLSPPAHTPMRRSAAQKFGTLNEAQRQN
jgi:hypothetical protein